MELVTFLHNIRDVLLKEKIKYSVLEQETIFRELEWDSMTDMMIIQMIDEKYNIEITGDEIKGCKKISDLYFIVQQKVKKTDRK